MSTFGVRTRESRTTSKLMVKEKDDDGGFIGNREEEEVNECSEEEDSEDIEYSALNFRYRYLRVEMWRNGHCLQGDSDSWTNPNSWDIRGLFVIRSLIIHQLVFRVWKVSADIVGNGCTAVGGRAQHKRRWGWNIWCFRAWSFCVKRIWISQRRYMPYIQNKRNANENNLWAHCFQFDANTNHLTRRVNPCYYPWPCITAVSCNGYRDNLSNCRHMSCWTNLDVPGRPLRSRCSSRAIGPARRTKYSHSSVDLQ